MNVKLKTYTGDCLDVLSKSSFGLVDLIYVDPPFFTQKIHRLLKRDGSDSFTFRDIWDSDSSYADFIYKRLVAARDTLKDTGSIFFHCDKSASHIVRLMLDSVFGPKRFQSEIIWSYKRWSNSKKGLLSAHQTIFFYSKTNDFKFNTFFDEYSASTNLDQIMQKRIRDERNKSVYARDEKGVIVASGMKKGVPLSDVWEIPYLNPKAKERVDYPTQKPIILLKRIIELVTDEGDTVLDPFCGSGTTLVAAKLLNRNAIGIDVSRQAIEVTNNRLKKPVTTESALLRKGRESYVNHDLEASKHLAGIEYLPIHRNKSIDGLLKQEINGLPAFIRVQRLGEPLGETIENLKNAAKNKGDCQLVVVVTTDELIGYEPENDVLLINSTSHSLDMMLKKLEKHSSANKNKTATHKKVKAFAKN